MTYTNTSIREYCRDLASIPVMANEESRRLVALAQTLQGPTLTGATLDTVPRNAVVEGNLRLVVARAKYWWHRGVDLDDLISAGNIGLIRAVEGFDFARVGYDGRPIRFSTVAVYYADERMRSAIKDRHLVHLPHFVQEELVALHQGRKAKPKRKSDLLQDADRVFSGGVLSLDREQDDTGGGPISGAEFVPAREERRVPDADDLAELYDLLKWRLDPRERMVLSMRFGLPPYSREYRLHEVGAEIGTTKEWARQIQKAALAKLRGAADAEPS